MSRVPFNVVIPARHASTRFPGKALADIAGKPMVVRVAERARESGAHRVHVATDHRDIAEAVRDAGFSAVMTRPDHASGTDRIAEAVERIGCDPEDIVVNVQGDEPLIEPGLIRAVAGLIADAREVAIATACHPIREAAELFNPNVVKVVLDNAGLARYFSRAPIPFARDLFARSYMRPRDLSARSDAAAAPSGSAEPLPEWLPCYRHIGIYAYRARFLLSFPKLAPSPLERAESLEQLRALWHGYAIAVTVRPEAAHPGVDTPEDLERIRASFDREPVKR